MNVDQYYKNLTAPEGVVDVIIDTDAYTEIDDLYAVSYMLKHTDKFNVKGVTIAPFYKKCRVNSVAESIDKSYDEIVDIMNLTANEQLIPYVFKGSRMYLKNEETPVESEAANFLAEKANEYSPEQPLYIVGIGALTNVASAILKNPSFKENCVVVWLGGHAVHMPNAADEYNLRNDIAAARIVMGCGVPFVLLPCDGVVDRFLTTEQELRYWLKGKNKLCDYLLKRTIGFSNQYFKGKPWSRVLWDVTAVAWLMNEKGTYLKDSLIKSPIPEYDKQYAFDPERHFIKYVYRVNRDALMEDLFNTLGK